MYEKMSPGKKILFLIAICFANIAVMGEMFFTPIIYNVYEAFWDANITVVNTIVSGPMLVIVVVSLLIAPTLLKKCGARTTLFIGGILFTVFGIAGYFAQTAGLLLVFRVFYAAGISLVTAAASTLIAQVCHQENDRNRVMGIYNAAMSAIGAVIALAAGVIAVNNWKNPFLMYAVGILMVILFFFLPKPENTAAEEEYAVKEAGGKKAPLGKAFWLLMIGFFVFNLAFGVTLYYGSVFTVENGLGNSAFAGLLSTMNTLGSVVCTIFYDKIQKVLKSKTGAVLYVLGGLAMLLPALMPNVVSTLIGYFVLGASYGLAFAFAFAKGSLLVPESRIGSAMSIATAAYSLGGFLTTYFVTAVQGIIKTDLVTPLYLVAGAICVLVAVYEFCCNLKKA